VNGGKTDYDSGSVSTETILACNNNVITEVSHIKFLGLTIDDTLSWNLHINGIMKRLTSVCYMVRAVKLNVLFFINNDLLFSVSFCLSLWYFILGNVSSGLILFKLQKRVVRIMMDQGYRT
jgi:hypothetical protein